MRWLLHLAGLVLLILAAVMCEWTIGGSTLADAFAVGFAGLACWCASGLSTPPPV